MNVIERKRPPVIRLPPKSNLELLLSRGAQVAIMVIGLIAFIFALHAGKMILAPFAMAVVIGLMLGPVASRLEANGIAPAFSAIAVVVLFIIAMSILIAAVATPLTYWAGRIPQIWNELQFKMTSLQEPLSTLKTLRDEIRSVTGNSNLTVQLEETSPVESVAVLAPTLLAQALVFFASLYFFVATRHLTRIALLKLCLTRRLRWRAAHIFRDVEALVSKYLLSITVINIGLGAIVSLALWACGVPSPLLWGALAGLMNFVVYIGPAIMALILFMVGLATYDTLIGSTLPPLVYLALNMIESEFITPMVIGKTMTMNPFIVFLAIAFWLWIWGPIGGFIAVPALLIVYAICMNIVPGIEWTPPERPVPLGDYKKGRLPP